MHTQARPSPVPEASAINAKLSGASFYDCYTIDVTGQRHIALEYFLMTIKRSPLWVERLMWLRNKVVQLVGLKDLGGMADFKADKPASAYRPGDRVGIFTLISASDDEMLVGDNDKHLNVELSLYRHPETAQGVQTLSITTVVHVHNWLGRLYMLPVKPMHKLIAPAVFNRIVLAQRVF
jgi:hypothetical protein